MRELISGQPLDNISGRISMLVLGPALIGTVNAELRNVHITILDRKIGKVI